MQKLRNKVANALCILRPLLKVHLEEIRLTELPSIKYSTGIVAIRIYSLFTSLFQPGSLLCDMDCVL